MTLKQLVDTLHEGRKVGLEDVGYLYINIDGKLMVEDLHLWFYPNEDELIGEIFRRHAECVVFPEEGP